MEPVIFDVRDTLGCLLIGIAASCCLFGVVIMQTYIYYTRFPNDKVYMKLLVFSVWSCELGHCLCFCHAIYSIMLVNGYGNPTDIIKPPKSLDVALSFSGIIGPIVQIFFAERVRIVSGKLYVPIICWIASSIRGVMTFVAMGEALNTATLPQSQTEWKWLVITVLATGSVIDLIISGLLAYYLKQHGKSTSSTIDKLIAWTIQTGLVTAANELAILISFLVIPNTFVWLAFMACLARMFSCSLLASLNGRTVYKERVPAKAPQVQRQASIMLTLENLSLEGSLDDPGKMKEITGSV